MVNGTDAKEIALYYLGKKELELNKVNIVKNIAIAKTILDLGFPLESILIAIDLNLDKMYSLGFIKFVIEEVHLTILANKKDEEIREALRVINNEKKVFSEVEDDGNTNRNREKLERRAKDSGERKRASNSLFK